MDAQPISTNDLREDMPAIKAKLLEGQSFYWIDRSKPIATINPLPHPSTKTKAMSKKEYRKYIESIAGGIDSKKPLSPKALNRLFDKQYEEMLPR